LQAAARLVVGRELPFNAAQLARALDPDHFIALRTVAGGVAPAATASLLDHLGAQLTADQAWLVAAQARLIAADDERNRLVAQRLNLTSEPVDSPA
ncbi:MAG: hypothetical protein KDD78_06485, partial [Caldilineaceae bacterium]|nr:hypothetical protein [Caldilineaceae bacterium]